MKVRVALVDDSLAWCTMRNQLWPKQKGVHRNEIEKYFMGKCFDIVQAFVLENHAGEVCGFIELNIRNCVMGSTAVKIPYVEGWFVDSDHRGNGSGALLIHAAEAWALEQGFSELASDADIENTTSIAAHKALGFNETDRIVCFLKKL